MTITLDEKKEGKLLEVQLSGKLGKEDYAHFVPTVNRLIGEHGKIRMLVRVHASHDLTVGAFWEDIKSEARNFDDVERVAIVGETYWEHGMALFGCFTGAKIRYFDRSEGKGARAWLEGD